MLGGGFEVYVVREDKTRYEEHKVEEAKGKLAGSVDMKCFLESEEGKIFKIVVEQQDHADHDWDIKLDIDGRKISRRFKDKCFTKETYRHLRFEKDGYTCKGKFCFAALSTTDKVEDVSIDDDHLASLGTMGITLWRGSRGTRGSDVPPRITTADVGVAHEKDKQLGGCTSVTDIERVDLQTRTYSFTKQDKEAFLKFTFNYRTRAVLEMMNVVQPVTKQDTDVAQLAGPSKRKRDSVKAERESDDESETVKRMRREVEHWKQQAMSAQKKLRDQAGLVDLSFDSD